MTRRCQHILESFRRDVFLIFLWLRCNWLAIEANEENVSLRGGGGGVSELLTSHTSFVFYIQFPMVQFQLVSVAFRNPDFHQLFSCL